MAYTTYLVDDLYTGSGTAIPYGCWTDSVTKFSAASFYNYEQDNLPLFDLEERTHFLWEKFGYPTSSIPGMTLLVSADAPQEAVVCQGNIFHDLSSAINALPRHLNFPVIIEVASFGDLGSLEISDIQMGPNGSLEIINRLTYDKRISLGGSYDGSASNLVTTGPHAGYENLWKDITSTKTDDYDGLLGFFGMIKGYSPSSLLGFPIFSGTEDDNKSANLALKPLDTRTKNSYVGFYATPAGELATAATEYEFTRLSVAELTLPTLINGSEELVINAALEEELNLPSIGEYDPSSYIQYLNNLTPVGSVGANELFRKIQNLSDPADKRVKGTYYGNYLRDIKITACGGPLYLRGFYCSGDGATTESGVVIKDSTVYLENLAVAKFTKHGVHAQDSKITFLGSLYAYRCYGLDSNGDRLSKPWETQNSKMFEAPTDESAAIDVVNSTIDFADSTEFYNTYIARRSPDLDGATYNQGINSIRVIARCSTGIRLTNSTMTGGKLRDFASISVATGSKSLDFLTLEGNANYAIELKNSHLGFKGRLEIVGNTRGVTAKNSSVHLNEMCFENNHIYGLHLNNSELQYGTYAVSSGSRFDYNYTALTNDLSSSKRYSYKFRKNGQHITAVNSKILFPEHSASIPSYLGRLFMSEAHGSNGSTARLPAIDLQNSTAKFIHLTSHKTGYNNRADLGAHILAKDNSEVHVLGSASSISCFLGGETAPTLMNQINNIVALAADKNSTIRFRGPVLIWDADVGAYANDNSNLIFEPHQKSGIGLDLEGFNLLTEDRSHTMIEIKSYRSCLVADKNSSIVMEDLGDFGNNWGSPYADNSFYNTLGLARKAAAAAGYLQFLPNPNEDSVSTGTLAARPLICRLQGTNGSYYAVENPFDPDPYNLSSVTLGGLCVKASNQSHVRVKNVHFPCGYWNPSSVIYDYDAADTWCSRTFIWNFSNNSTMNMDHVSVSGTFPALAGYHGPIAVWTSGANAAAYAAPSGTPDTSTLSVLDYYGSGIDNTWKLPNGDSTRYGQNGFFNQGPFRLYLGVDSLATRLFDPNYDPGNIIQIFAQGYNYGFNLSATADTSGLYGKLLRVSQASGLESSGFYYANEFVHSNPNLIMLDESAANTFANAKNGAMGTSNRPQICMIYSSKTDEYGEGKARAFGLVQGTGFKSPNMFDLLEEC